MAANKRIDTLLGGQFRVAIAAHLDVASATALAEALEKATDEACRALAVVRPPLGWNGVKVFGMDADEYLRE